MDTGTIPWHGLWISPDIQINSIYSKIEDEKMLKEKEVQHLSEVTVRFAGDSGDGMQLTGSQFSDTTALLEMI